ncbi:divisome protein SepX/GlpR [Gandjariella thermophila]|uniref:Uncharacterized protein n=1 Tax=Gandjariella thermophila TaxID=1931992 RepID=A0A4D4JGG6_9PSEU|nr:gephyrin-like molybdotransferase receptor GlpR [Gandjariella thermophila]GDY33506.1 hypothetical protein GTS_51390 [Gandjariella thermophila]
MPSSLIIVALAVAWLMILVPMIARRRQEVAKTADSALAARVVRSGSTVSVAKEEFDVADTARAGTDRAGEHYRDQRRRARQPVDIEPPDDEEDDADYETRPYRPGRGGFDPRAAAAAARAKYAFRQRVVLFLLFTAVATALFAAFAMPVAWWAHGADDLLLVCYLTYLRRQVRIEEEIRQRRLARLAAARRRQAAEEQVDAVPAPVDEDGTVTRLTVAAPHRSRPDTPNLVVVEIDDEDPAFEELQSVREMPYRRAAGE